MTVIAQPITFEIRPFNTTDRRDAFECDEPSLTDYVRTGAGQDSRRHAAVTYVLVGSDDPTRIIGYYTLASTSIALAGFPPEIARKLPKYPNLPATLLGRLAVNTADAGKRHGERLLVDALANSLRVSERVASLAVIVDALHEKAAGFYRRYEFTPFVDNPLRLYLAMKDIKAALSRSR